MWIMWKKHNYQNIRCKTHVLEQDGAPFLENERLETEMIRL